MLRRVNLVLLVLVGLALVAWYVVNAVQVCDARSPCASPRAAGAGVVLVALIVGVGLLVARLVRPALRRAVTGWAVVVGLAVAAPVPTRDITDNPCAPEKESAAYGTFPAVVAPFAWTGPVTPKLRYSVRQMDVGPDIVCLL